MGDEGDRDPDAGTAILAAVERRVGDSRYAGGWIDTEGRRVSVAVVDPSAQEVDEALAIGRETGWRVSVHAVSYSRAELIALSEDLDPPAKGTVARCGWAPS